MNKEHFHKAIDEIEVPTNDIIKAIHQGIDQGKKASKKKAKLKMVGIISSIAASMFLASGLIFAPINNVLASVPVIGSIYQKLGSQIGHELSENNLITQLNQEATSNGVNVTLTSAYYDSNVIGITFKAEGKKLSLDSIGDTAPESGYRFHIFDGVEQKQWSGTMAELNETAEGYIGAIELYNPEENLSAHFTLPVTFTSMAGVNGLWKFDVPVEQIPLATIDSSAKGILEGTDYSLEMESVIKGKATTQLKYKTTYPSIGKYDTIAITVFDSEGNRLSKNHADVLSTKQNNGIIETEIRELFNGKLDENAEYLSIHPVINRYEKDTVKPLQLGTPFIIESSRFNYKIKVNNIEMDGKKLTLDYHLQNVDTNAIKKDIIQSFADSITLIMSDHIYKDNNGELDMNKIIGYQIKSNKTETIGMEDLHFQSTFEFENAFNFQDYSLMIPFGLLSLNDDIEMEPIKMYLK